MQARNGRAEYVADARRWASSRRRAGATISSAQTWCRGKSIDFSYDTIFEFLQPSTVPTKARQLVSIGGAFIFQHYTAVVAAAGREVDEVCMRSFKVGV